MLLYNYIIDICNYIPSIILVSSISFGVIFNNIRGFIFFGLGICCSIINIFLKTFIFKPIYYKYGNRNIPLLGRGDRPTGHPKLDMFENYYKHSVSFGMPSGHSQLICFFSSFWILQIIYSKTRCKYVNYNKLTLRDNISIVYLTLISVLVMYSRYLRRFHTIQQVILGGIIGCGLGILSFTVFKKHFVKKKVVKKIVKKRIPTNSEHETKILSGVNQYTHTNDSNGMQVSPLDKHLNERQSMNRGQFTSDINKALDDMEFKQQNIIHSNKLNEVDDQIKTRKEYDNSPQIHTVNVIS